MFDTIGTYLESNVVHNVVRYLSDVKENIDTNSGLITTYGKFQNLRVKVKDNVISLQGSLPKFFFNDNIQELTRKHTQEAIENLSDGLHIDISRSKPYRIDIASNFIMNEPLQKYYASLESLARYEKKPYRDGILFTTNKITLEFYDKNKELKKNKNELPEIFLSRNILRYEVHLKKRLPELFKQNILTSHLYNEQFYLKAVDKWKELYFKINKNRIINFNQKVLSMLDTKTLFNELALIGLNQIGKETFLNMLEIERSNFTKMQFKRIKDKINSISTLPELTEFNDAIKELDSKVIQRVKYYR